MSLKGDIKYRAGRTAYWLGRLKAEKKKGDAAHKRRAPAKTIKAIRKKIDQIRSKYQESDRLGDRLRARLVFRKSMLNGHGDVDAATRRFIVRGVYAGLVVTSTTGGQHAPGSYHYRKAAADLGLPPHLVGTTEGRNRMVAFQREEAKDPGRYNELFGPDNGACVKNGARTTLAEGSALEDLHDNHVHGAPRR